MTIRKPSLTANVVADLECLASVGLAALAGHAADAQTPQVKSRVRRAVDYLEGLARWHADARVRLARARNPGEGAS